MLFSERSAMNEDTKKILRSMSYANESHDGQKRKYTGEPYIVHPMDVVEITCAITDFECSSDMIAAAWLHDVLEDTNASQTVIKLLCGEKVLELVLELTNKSKREDGNRATRKKIDREALWQASEEAQIIKCADMISNCHSIYQYDKGFWWTYSQEKIDLLSGFRDNSAKQLALDVVNGYMSNKV